MAYLHRYCFGLLLVLLWGLPAFGAGALPHDFHVCITEINHNAETHALEITVKFFTDDIERSVRALGGGELRLGDARELPDADAKLLAYLQNRLSLRVNGQPASFQWVGKEVEFDALWCYVEVPDVAQLDLLEVTNRILTEVFEDQANVIHVTAHGSTQSLFLNKTELSGRISF